MPNIRRSNKIIGAEHHCGTVSSFAIRLTALFLGSLIITGCPPKSNTEQVKASYAKIWNDRAAKYQQEILVQASPQLETSAAAKSISNVVNPEMKKMWVQRDRILLVAKKGALEVLTSFNELRKKEPGLDIVEDWFKKQRNDYAASLPEQKMKLRGLIEIISGKSIKADAPINFDNSQFDKIGFALGALWELNTISTQLRQFNDNYRSAARKDAAYRAANPTPPLLREATRAAIVGARIGAGR